MNELNWGMEVKKTNKRDRNIEKKKSRRKEKSKRI
jgi:hypothetical protein